MPQDRQSPSEHDLILKKVESLRVALEQKTNGEAVMQNGGSQSEFVSQRQQEFECKTAELQCHIDFFEKAFETQQKVTVAYTTAEIEKLLESNKKLELVFTSQKEHLHTLHKTADELLGLSQGVDASKVKTVLEKADERWNHVLCSIKGQAKFLENLLNTYRNFDRNIQDFLSWLEKMESVVQNLDDVTQTEPAQDSVDGPGLYKTFKNVSFEMDAHQNMLESLNSTGNQMIVGLQQDARDTVQAQLDNINQRWNKLRAQCDAVQKVELRQRQEKQAKAFNLLLQKLIELDAWLNCVKNDMSSNTTPDCNVDSLNSQVEHCQALCQQLEAKSSQVENYLRLGKQSLEKAKKHKDSSESEDLHLLVETVSVHLMQMDKKWLETRDRAQQQHDEYNTLVKRLELMEKQISEVKYHLVVLESVKTKWLDVSEILASYLQGAVNQTRSFEAELTSIKMKLNECNSSAEHLQKHSLKLSQDVEIQLQDINRRCHALESAVEERLTNLMITALKKIDPTTQHQLALAVMPPWKRAVTDGNNVPYYINHETQTTQWNHPEMTNILHTLAELNNVKFSAYRTAMKLRVLQKRLLLEKLDVNKLLELFNQNNLTCHNDRPMAIIDIIKCLTSAISKLEMGDSKVSGPLIIDLLLNWLLNVYDKPRIGQIWPMAFKIALLLMSSGSLEDKYQALFNLTSDENNRLDEFHLSLLLQECILIPSQLGEATAFGGINVEASVASCFEKAGGHQTIDFSQFLHWMKMEPQSLVWIPVMHRLAESENIRHEAKCSICGSSPIMGLRYRCLKCSNFDMCQSCFLLGRTVKSHNLTHPMHEYSTLVTSNEDVRDRSKVFRNKFRSQQYYKKHPRLGYLPVQSTMEVNSQQSLGSSFKQTSKSATTLEMHSRVELCANRLAELEKRNPSTSESSEDEHDLIGHLVQSLGGSSCHSLQLQSPLQIIMALDADQKSELDAVMKDLENENKSLQEEYDHLKQDSRSLVATRDFHGSSRTDENYTETADNPDLEMIAETKLLRLYKERLESRMEILEEHNSRLNSQLLRLRQILSDQPGKVVVYPLKQSMTVPSVSSASSQNSVSRQGPPSFSMSTQLTDNQPSKAESDANDVVFDVADVGRELDRLTDSISSYSDPFVKEEMV